MNKRYDVLVVGAGIIGLSSAYHIKETHPELSVVIIDRAPAAGQGDTAKSNAALRDTFTSTVNRTLARSSIEFYKHVQTDIGFNKRLEPVHEVVKARRAGFIGDLTPALGTPDHAAGDGWQVWSALPPIIRHHAEGLGEIPIGCPHDSPRLRARLEHFPVRTKQIHTQR